MVIIPSIIGKYICKMRLTAIQLYWIWDFNDRDESRSLITVSMRNIAADYTMQQLAIVIISSSSTESIHRIPLFFVKNGYKNETIQREEQRKREEKRANQQFFFVEKWFWRHYVNCPVNVCDCSNSRYCQSHIAIYLLRFLHALAAQSQIHTQIRYERAGPDDEMNNKTWPQRVQVTFYSAFIVRFPCTFFPASSACVYLSFFVDDFTLSARRIKYTFCYCGLDGNSIAKGRINISWYFHRLRSFCCFVRIWIYLFIECCAPRRCASFTNKSIRFIGKPTQKIQIMLYMRNLSTCAIATNQMWQNSIVYTAIVAFVGVEMQTVVYQNEKKLYRNNTKNVRNPHQMAVFSISLLSSDWVNRWSDRFSKPKLK